MKTVVWTYLLICLVVLIGTGPARAQSDTDDRLAARVLTELERTDELIERAQGITGNVSDPRAALAMDQARRLQSSAWDYFRNRNFWAARKHTHLAREKLRYLLANGALTERSRDVVFQRLERAEQVLDRSTDALAGMPDDRMMSLLRKSRENLRRAWELHRAGQHLPSLKLANQVVNAARRILDMADKQVRNESNYRLRADNVQDLMLRTQELIEDCDSEAGPELLRQARDAYRKAEEPANKQDFTTALRLLQQARDLTFEAARKCQGPDGLRQRYDRLKGLADRLNEEIPLDDDAGRRLLTQIYEQLDRARESIEQNDTQSAAAELRAIQLTLDRLRDRTSESSL